MKYQYHFTGAEGKYFPELKFTTESNDPQRVYESDVLANHPELELLNTQAQPQTEEPEQHMEQKAELKEEKNI